MSRNPYTVVYDASTGLYQVLETGTLRSVRPCLSYAAARSRLRAAIAGWSTGSAM